MRNFSEPTARNFLREPQVLGLPLPVLMILCLGTCGIILIGANASYSNAFAGTFAIGGYVGMRAFSKLARNGWEERLLFFFERLVKRDCPPTLLREDADFAVLHPETADTQSLLQAKLGIEENLRDLQAGDSVVYQFKCTQSGTKISKLTLPSDTSFGYAGSLHLLSSGLASDFDYVYSLFQLPTRTDPLTLQSLMRRVGVDYRIFVRIDGIDQTRMKKSVEVARRRAAPDDATVSDVDCSVSFEEASSVLEGISRGEEHLVSLSLVFVSDRKLPLDPELFLEEKDKRLAIASILGIRARKHRSLIARATNAADLIPTVEDPCEAGYPLFQSRRNRAIYFNPLDSRFEARHWIVSGASGAGKSFFVGLVLRRLLQRKAPLSVLILDHNRGFRRFVFADEHDYYEPEDFQGVTSIMPNVFTRLDHPGRIVGVELSDLYYEHKDKSIEHIFHTVEQFLRSRRSNHTVFVVIDECWQYLLNQSFTIQRAFREYRKLNAAAIAITQSLSDFIANGQGKSIFQNAPIRVLLRQGEDLLPYRGFLGLNDLEAATLPGLTQRRGKYSECLIKTPVFSRVARLKPTEEEFALFQTDDLSATGRDEICKG